ALMFDAAPSTAHLLGNALALAMTILIAAMMVIIRHSRRTSMLPAASLSAFACSILVMPMASPGAATGIDLVYLVLFGTTQFGLGLLLLTVGTRLISATRSALVGSLETPLAPLWVWLAFGEIPAVMTGIGGVIVMVAVLGDMLLARPGIRANERTVDDRAPARTGGRRDAVSADAVARGDCGPGLRPGRSRTRPG